MGRAIGEPLHPAGLERSLRAMRDEIESTLGALEGALGESLDWRAWTRRHAWPSLALAFLVGLRLGRGRWL
jgi:hypothetical protein